MTTWSTSFPGIVTPGCGDVDGALEVHHETGRMLRIGSEARLCFDCGPDGGIYHPDQADMPAIRTLAKDFDRQFNRFEVHSHHTVPGGKDGPDIEHAHTDGSEPHRHPETATAKFAITSEDKARYLGGGAGEKPRQTRTPDGPQLAFVELSEEERIFRIVGQYRYVNPSQRPGKPDEQYSRATWRRSEEFYIAAARHPGSVVVGPGAVPLAAARIMLSFRLEPRYEIEGWTPTPWLGLP